MQVGAYPNTGAFLIQEKTPSVPVGTLAGILRGPMGPHVFIAFKPKPMVFEASSAGLVIRRELAIDLIAYIRVIYSGLVAIQKAMGGPPFATQGSAGPLVRCELQQGVVCCEFSEPLDLVVVDDGDLLNLRLRLALALALGGELEATFGRLAVAPPETTGAPVPPSDPSEGS